MESGVGGLDVWRVNDMVGWDVGRPLDYKG